MMKNKKVIFLTLLLIFALFVVTACSTNNGTTIPNTPNTTKQNDGNGITKNNNGNGTTNNNNWNGTNGRSTTGPGMDGSGLTSGSGVTRNTNQ